MENLKKKQSSEEELQQHIKQLELEHKKDMEQEQQELIKLQKLLLKDKQPNQAQASSG